MPVSAARRRKIRAFDARDRSRTFIDEDTRTQREDRFCIAHRSYGLMQCECRPARTTLTLINTESLICMHGNDFCEGAPARISLIIAQVLIAGATGVSISREAEHARREDPRLASDRANRDRSGSTDHSRDGR